MRVFDRARAVTEESSETARFPAVPRPKKARLAAGMLACSLAAARGGSEPAPTARPPLRPSPEMARLLEAFEGDWTVHETFEIGSRHPGAVRDGTARFREGAGFSLVEDYLSDGTAGELRFLGVFWWDPAARVYRLLTCANDDGCEVRGTLRWEGDALVNSWQEREGGRTVAYRDSFVRIARDSFTLVSEGASEGKTVWRVTTTYKRQAPARASPGAPRKIGRAPPATFARRRCSRDRGGHTMAPVAFSPVTEAPRTLLRETFEGPSGPSTYFIDNDPKAGLFATLGALSAEEASRRLGASGASIAGHAFHVGFHLDTSSAWLRGDREPRDWSRSWTVTAVDEPGWAELRSRLRRQFEDLLRAIETAPPDDGESLATTIGAVAHAAYHLGAIRQRIAVAASGPASAG